MLKCNEQSQIQIYPIQNTMAFGKHSDRFLFEPWWHLLHFQVRFANNGYVKPCKVLNLECIYS